MPKDHKVILSAILSVSIILLIVAVVIMIFRSPLIYSGKAAELPVGLRMVPDTSVLTQSPGVNVSVNLIPEDHAVSLIDLVLEYNPKLLTITENDVSLGTLLPVKLGSVKIETINENLNTVRVLLLAKCASSVCSPAVTSGKIANLLFKGTSANTSATVSFSVNTKVYLASDISTSNSGYQYTTNKINLLAGSTNSDRMVLKPIADSYVKAAYPTKNYSAEDVLVASDYEASNHQLAYIKYDLSDVSGRISKAKLRIVPRLTRSVSKPIKIVSSSSWDEKTITWNNKPSVGNEIGRYIGSAKIGEALEIDLNVNELNKYINNKLTISVGGDADFNNTLQFSSREAVGSEPQLIIESEAGAKVITMYPSDDTYVQSQSDRADKSYGDQTTLTTSTYESSNTRISYLKFNDTQLVGKQIRSAELVIVPSLSRKVQKVVKNINETNWSEDTLNYNNRPAAGTVIGSFNFVDSAVEVGKPIMVNLDPANLKVSSDGSISVSIDNLGSDDTLSVYSKEYSTIDFRPKLIVEVF